MPLCIVSSKYILIWVGLGFIGIEKSHFYAFSHEDRLKIWRWTLGQAQNIKESEEKSGVSPN